MARYENELAAGLHRRRADGKGNSGARSAFLDAPVVCSIGHDRFHGSSNGSGVNVCRERMFNRMLYVAAALPVTGSKTEGEA